MQILDHWRMEDGRLVVLMQALERFVVKEIVNTRPYAVANIQILLNEEELPWGEGGDHDKIMTKTSSTGARKHSGIRDVGSKCKFLRGAAAATLFWYHEYEFNEPMLEIYLTKEDVLWLQILSLLPFTRYSADNWCLNGANSMAARGVNHVTTASGNDNNGSDGGLPKLTVEQKLQNGSVL
jgi:hypothetical protein